MRITQHPEALQNTIPLTVISGAAGAGKSTVLRHLMESASARRVVAVVHDLGALVDDQSAVSVRREGAFVQWPSGSIAIATDDPTATLAALARMTHRAHHVIVEADSASNPRRFAGYAYMPGYGPDCTVAVVDACASELAALPPRGDERTFAQLQHADVVVLNKLDVAGRDAAAKLQHSLGLIAPAARFVWTRHGRVAPSLLLGPAGHLDAADGPVVTAEWRPDYLPKDKRSSVSMLGEYCRSWQLVSRRPVAVKDFRNWVGRLATTILRASGVVFIEEDQTHRHEFSLIGSRWQLRRSSPWGEETPSTTITMVGISARDRVTRDSASVPFITSPTSLATPMGQVM